MRTAQFLSREGRTGQKYPMFQVTLELGQAGIESPGTFEDFGAKFAQQPEFTPGHSSCSMVK
jgi:hypothetical protein